MIFLQMPLLLLALVFLFVKLALDVVSSCFEGAIYQLSQVAQWLEGKKRKEEDNA